MLRIAHKTSTYEGKLKKQVFHQGQYWDVFAFGILKNEFEEKYSYALKLGLDYVKTKKYYN